jgi:hypothetical protein
LFQIKNNILAQKILQSPVSNLKSRYIHENLESKKYIMGCRGGLAPQILVRFVSRAF